MTEPTGTPTLITLGKGDDAFPVYVARPALTEGQKPKGGLIVIHEIWGLVDHITSIADRFAAEGYLVVAPDILSHVGIHPELGVELNEIMKSTDEAVRTEGQPRLREAFSAMNAPGFAAWAVPALQRVVDYLDEQPGVDGRIAVTGFCFGGTYSFALAAADDRVLAAIPFYGAPPELAEVPNISARVLALYGRNDPRLIDGLPEVAEAMQRAGVDFESKIYEGTGHAFFNDTNEHAYDADAAADAWSRANAFLSRVLS